MEQFRPNLVVSGVAAGGRWLEGVLRINDVIFDVVKPCSRCILRQSA